MANSSRRIVSPNKLGNPVRGFGEGSWNVLLDIKGTVERLDERTENIKTDISEIKSDVAAAKTSIAELPGKGMFWSGIAAAVTIIGMLIGAYWVAMTYRFDAVNSRIDSLKPAQSQVQSPPPVGH